MIYKQLPNPGYIAEPGDTLDFPALPGEVDSASDPIGRDLDLAGGLGSLTRSLSNLQGALIRRLQTPRGYLPHHPEYGSRLPEFIGRGLDYDTVSDIRAEVFDVLPLDPRVISVDSVDVVVEGDGVFLNVVVTTPVGPLTVTGVIQAI